MDKNVILTDLADDEILEIRFFKSKICGGFSRRRFLAELSRRQLSYLLARERELDSRVDVMSAYVSSPGTESVYALFSLFIDETHADVRRILWIAIKEILEKHSFSNLCFLYKNTKNLVSEDWELKEIIALAINSKVDVDNLVSQNEKSLKEVFQGPVHAFSGQQLSVV